jgi:hypothetical protein
MNNVELLQEALTDHKIDQQTIKQLLKKVEM